MVSRNERRRRARVAQAEAANAQKPSNVNEVKEKLLAPGPKAKPSTARTSLKLKHKGTTLKTPSATTESKSAADPSFIPDPKLPRRVLFYPGMGKPITGTPSKEQLQHMKTGCILKVRVKEFYKDLPEEYRTEVLALLRIHIHWERAILLTVRKYHKERGINNADLAEEVLTLEKIDNFVRATKLEALYSQHEKEYKNLMKEVDEERRKVKELRERRAAVIEEILDEDNEDETEAESVVNNMADTVDDVLDEIERLIIEEKAQLKSEQDVKAVGNHDDPTSPAVKPEANTTE